MKLKVYKDEKRYPGREAWHWDVVADTGLRYWHKDSVFDVIDCASAATFEKALEDGLTALKEAS